MTRGGLNRAEYLQKMMTAREGCDRRSAYTLMGCIAKLGGGFFSGSC
jgi:hypothetical protein